MIFLEIAFFVLLLIGGIESCMGPCAFFAGICLAFLFWYMLFTVNAFLIFTSFYLLFGFLWSLKKWRDHVKSFIESWNKDESRFKTAIENHYEIDPFKRKLLISGFILFWPGQVLYFFFRGFIERFIDLCSASYRKINEKMIEKYVKRTN